MGCSTFAEVYRQALGDRAELSIRARALRGAAGAPESTFIFGPPLGERRALAGAYDIAMSSRPCRLTVVEPDERARRIRCLAHVRYLENRDRDSTGRALPG